MSDDLAQSCPVRRWALNTPEAPALAQSGDVVTYAAWDRHIDAYRAALTARGINRGDRVLIAAPPSVGYCTLLWALFRNEMIACPVNPAFPSGAMSDIAALIRPACVICESNETLPASLAPLSCTLNTLAGESEDRQPSEDIPLDFSAPATLVLTSGSAGRFKAAVLSLGNHLHAARLANANMPLAMGDRWLLSLPLYHVSGLAVLFRCALAGACVALPAPGSSLAEALAETRATHVSLVPTQLLRLLDLPKGLERLTALKGALLGGAPAGNALIRRACTAGVPLVNSYGMTETAAQCCATPPGAVPETLGTSGKPLAPDTLRINDQEGIEVHGPAVFMGYWMENGSLNRPFTGDGWFATGDMGFLDDRGYLHVTGRADAMFISGGENIHPEEIERILLNQAGVRQALVVDVPDREYGSVPVAFMDMEEGCTLEERTLLRALELHLPRFKLPKAVYAWPRDEAGQLKPSRARFRQQAAELRNAENQS